MSREYWVIINEKQIGPLELEQVINTPGVGPATPVWREGLEDWSTLGELDETAVVFNRKSESKPPQYTYAPGSQEPTAPQEPMPETYVVLSILSLFCCCMPTGVVALVYASRVSPLYQRGDYEGSVNASEKAKLWVIISAVIWGVSTLLYLALVAMCIVPLFWLLPDL